MLIAIRHGDTELNDPKGEKIRGWLPIPLSPKGMGHAMDAAKYLKKTSLADPNKPILTSDLPRAVQTAQEIASELGTTIEPKEQLRDWNVGKFTGQPVQKSLPDIFHYLENPNEKIPDGESYNDYYNRSYPFLKQLVESPDINSIVTHNRTMTLLHALTKSGGSSPKIQDLKDKGPVEPGGMMIIGPDWKQIHTDGLGDSRA